VTFKVGDIVEYAEVGTSNWVGGKGKVISVYADLHYPVTVECLEVPQKILDVVAVDDNDFIGKVGNFREDNLILVKSEDVINDPSHYGGKDNPYEVIKVAEAWGLHKNAYLFNVLKYIARAEKKGTPLHDKKKARYYIDRDIANDEAAAK
jgi:Protein of unknwon function (DUF3310)